MSRSATIFARACPSSTLFGSDGDRCNQREKTSTGKFRQEEQPNMSTRRAFIAATAALAFAFSANQALAQKKYDTGASDTEIKIGQTVPFSGAYSVYANIGKTQAAYFKMINDQGGINGRKINLIQYDDAYSPPKTVEQVRKLVEGDEVLFTFQIIGTAANAAVQKYLNGKKIPQLLASTALRASTIRRTTLGPLPTIPTTSPRDASTPSTFSRSIPTPRSACSTRTTTWAATISPASRAGSATRPPA